MGGPPSLFFLRQFFFRRASESRNTPELAAFEHKLKGATLRVVCAPLVGGLTPAIGRDASQAAHSCRSLTRRHARRISCEMATTTVAAAGTALALYYYSRRQCGPGDAEFETHANAHSAPKSFLEDLYFFAEGLRWVCACVSRRLTER